MSSSLREPERILVLSDEPRSARSLSSLLAAAGYEVYCCDSVAEAPVHVRRLDCSLVLLEIGALRFAPPCDESPLDAEPGVSARKRKWSLEALTFCEQLRAQQSSYEVPVVVISRSPAAQDKVACLNAGAADYVTRPYQRTELLSRIKAHLRLARSERERAERFSQMNVLHDVSTVLASSLEPQVIMSGALKVLTRHLRASAGAIFLRSPERAEPIVVAAEGFDLDEQSRVALSSMYRRAEAVTDVQPVLVDHPAESIRVAGADGATGEVGRLVVAPIRAKGARTGGVLLAFAADGPLPGQHAELISIVCAQLGVALENARLYVETKKSAAQLAFVYNLGNNLMTSLEMDELLGYAVFSVGRSLKCDACAVIVRAPSESQSLLSAIYAPSSEGEKSAPTEWFEESRVKEYLSAGARSLNTPIEMRVSKRFLTSESITLENVVPLVFDESLLGLMICGSARARQFSSDEQRLIVAVAQQLSLAIRNTELYQRTRDTSINLAVEVARRTREIEGQKRFIEKIVDSLPVSLYVVDRDMRIVAWNRNREIGGQGISRAEVLGKNVFNVLAKQPRRQIEEEFTDVFRTGDMLMVEQESHVDGEKRVWKIGKIPMRVDNAEVTHVITVGEDITEQKKMNEAVMHAEKLASIGRLAAGVVHELNNPLATIAACAESLSLRLDELHDHETGNDFQEYLRIVRDEAFRCKTITNSLLDFAHQRQAEKASCDINDLINQTLQLTRHHPKLGSMRIIKDLGSSLPLVYVNEGQMKQILIALISNAFDAIEGEGSLTIRTAFDSTAGMVCTELTDTGCGIPSSQLPKIFEPFFTTKPLGRGTGLGLSVCYGIVSEHGGRLEVDSTEGVGSTFRVLLPVTPEAVTGQPLDQPQTEVGDLESVL